MAKYGSTRQLLNSLTSDEADTRAQAYQDCYEAGFQPGQVRRNPPEEDLREAGLIPEKGPDYPDTGERFQEIRDILEEIRDEVAQ